MDLVDLFFEFPDLYFKAFLVDKQHPGFDLQSYFRSSWEAQISYARLLLRHVIAEDEQAAVLADYLTKPKASTLFFEEEIAKIARYAAGGVGETEPSLPPSIFNACMLESDASLFVQLVDVLLGLVVYNCKLKRGVHPPNAAKVSVLNALKRHLGRQDLCSTLDADGPPYFGEDEDPPDGEVVVALLRGGAEVTVKRFYREGEMVRLKPENGDHEELVVPDEDLKVQGRVVYVVHPPRRR